MNAERLRKLTLEELEQLVLAYRYMYYVTVRPLISDREYDNLETFARSVLPPSSPVQGVGSDRAASYSKEVIALANSLIEI